MTSTNLARLQPHTYEAMQAFSEAAEKAAHDAGLDVQLVELIKIRASQLNGCAYCLRLHTRDALKAGETAERLALVAAWWESEYFSDVERAALALTEHITDMTGTAPRHRVDIDINAALGENQFAAVAWLAVAINAWNRIAVTSHYPVAPQRHETSAGV